MLSSRCFPWRCSGIGTKYASAGIIPAALIALIYIECGYQFLLMAPDMLGTADPGGLDSLLESGVGEMGDFPLPGP